MTTKMTSIWNGVIFYEHTKVTIYTDTTMKSFFFLCALAISLLSCSSTPSSNNKLIAATHLKMAKPAPLAGKTLSNQEIYLGGFSGLLFNEEINGDFLFQTITDRGPNGYSVGAERPFLLPEFSPQILSLKTNLKNGTFEVVSTLKLKKKSLTPLTGLPNVRVEENPVDIFGHMLSLDPDGLDTEALVADDEGGYWVGDEYAPSLVHFDNLGIMKRRLMPFNELPKMYSERKPNRGFEGIAKVQNKVFGILQSPLPFDQGFARIVEVDLDTMKTSAEYFYDFKKGMDKVSDMVHVKNGQFLVIESNGKRGEESKKLIYKITLQGSDSHVTKELLIDLKKTPFNAIEKVEGIALISPNKIALVNDNDFQISAKTDPATGITPLNSDDNEMLILEFSQEI
jgi:hypothetical protein